MPTGASSTEQPWIRTRPVPADLPVPSVALLAVPLLLPVGTVATSQPSAPRIRVMGLEASPCLLLAQSLPPPFVPVSWENPQRPAVRRSAFETGSAAPVFLDSLVQPSHVYTVSYEPRRWIIR